MTFLGYPDLAAFLAACDDVRAAAVELYRRQDTPQVLLTRQRDAHEAAARNMPWE